MIPRRRSRERRAATSLALLVLVSVSSLCAADDVIPHRQDRVPNRPYSPEEARERMTLPEGFFVDLVASEPEIVNPLAMTFDDRGRLWITESVEYPRADEGAGRDTVKILDRFDENGRATRIRTFVDDLNIPSGIAVGHGGVWVLSAPDLLFFREENGRAVGREVVVTGFGRTDRHEVPNSLVWGPDGWLYGLNGVFNRSRVVSGDKTFDFTCALYRIHPRTREFRIVSEGTSNPWGLIFERDGQAIISACHWAKDHIFHFVETARYQRQAGPQPAWAWPLGSASDHGHQKTAYCGLAWLSSDEFPPPWRDRIVLGNVHGGAINSDILERDGSTFLSRKAPDLLNANDVWFMPVAQAIGPDGCLWVLDWYDRYHCYQDANRDPEGIDRARGRIWRIRHGDAPAMPTFDLANESDESLVGRLGSPNVLFRERAQRVLAERGTSSARDALERLVRDPHADRRARLHGLWSLIGMGPLPAELHRDLLVSPDSTFRAWAVRAAGEMGEVDSSVRERVIALAFDASPDVRLEVAIAARKLRGIDPLVVLVDALSAGEIDRFLPAIAWEGLHDLIACHPTQFVARVAQADLARSPALASILPRAIERLLSEDALDSWSVARLLEKILQGHDDLLVRALGTIAERVPLLSEERSSTCVKALRPAILALAAREDGGIASSTARLLGGRLGIVSLDIDSVFATLADAKLSEDLRVRSLEALVAIEAEGTAAAAAKAIDHAPAELASRLVAALGRLDDSSAMEVLLSRIENLQGEARETALDLLVERQRWARRLLDRVLEGKLPKDTLRPEHLRRILDGNDRDAIWAIEKRWGEIRRERDPEREVVAQRLIAELEDEIGDPTAGRDVFRSVCSGCHTIYGEGTSLGPDLSTNGRGSFAQLISNLVDPNLVVGPGYHATTVITTDGRVLSGLARESTPERIVVAARGGREEAIPRALVKDVREEPLSFMPEGLEMALTRRELVDLVAFLALDGPPGDPPPRAIPGAPQWVNEVASGKRDAE